MKRNTLIKYLRENNCLLLREGANHTIFYNTKNNKTSSVPRHNEIINKLIYKICKDLTIPKPK